MSSFDTGGTRRSLEDGSNLYSRTPTQVVGGYVHASSNVSSNSKVLYMPLSVPPDVTDRKHVSFDSCDECSSIVARPMRSMELNLQYAPPLHRLVAYV